MPPVPPAPLARFARLALAVLLCTGTGCVLVLGLRDDYVADDAAPEAGDAAEAASDAEQDAGPSVFTFLGEPTGTCVSCLTSKCADQASACAADPSCKAAVDCMGRCSPTKDGPGCFDRCDLAIATPARGLYVGCASTQCLEECQFGAELGCVGSYAWPPARPDGGQVDVVLRIVTHERNAPRPGIPVTPCVFNGLDFACDEAGTRTTDQTGSARLALGLRVGAGTSVPEAWNGYLSATDPSDGGEEALPSTLLRETRPFYETRGEPLLAPLASIKEIRTAYTFSGGQKVGTGSVLGVVNDCRAVSATQRARGVHVSIADSGVSAVYTRSTDSPEPDAKGTIGGGFYILNVPAGHQQIIEVTLPDGGFYARARLDVEDGGVTTISINPQPTNVERQ